MPNYTLYYFNARGRAEICRMLFAAGGVQYQDKRIEFSEWDRCKNEFPCQYLPCLEMEVGHKIPEMMAISRHLAREFGFYPTSNVEMFRCDYICDCFYDILDDYLKYFHWRNGRFRFGKDGVMLQGNVGMMDSPMQSGGDMQSAEYETYLKAKYLSTFNRIMPFLEKMLCMKNNGSQFFLGEQLMWCDLFCHCFVDTFMIENQNLFTSYPKIMALYTRVASHPKISGYLKSRPTTTW